MGKLNSKWILKCILGILSIITLTITSYFCYKINRNLVLNSRINWDVTGQVGDYFGGVIGTLIAAIGFIILFLSFVSQTESQIEQKNQFLISQIETRFFELVKLHKENLLSLSYKNPKTGIEIESHKLVDFIYKQFADCYKELSPFFSEPNAQEIYTKKGFAEVELINLKQTGFDISGLARIDIAYSIVFFGTSADNINTLKRLFSDKYNEQFISDILRYISLKPLNNKHLENWKTVVVAKDLSDSLINKLIEKYKSNGSINSLNEHDPSYLNAFQELLDFNKKQTYRYYGGHQYKLGHYFRHLFQSVKYINEKEILDYRQKYEYIKILRAQLSTIEQYLVFLNSLSFMGREWELNHVRNEPSELDTNKRLITKFNFIKNLPDLLLQDTINILNYYPDVHFEFRDQPKERAELNEKLS